VDSINAKAVTINLHASVDDIQKNNEQTRSLDKIVTPFSIAVNSLSLVSFNFSFDGIDVSANDISAQANWQQNTVTIDYFEVSNASLLLPQEQSVEKATKTDDSRLFEISPIEFSTPLNWQVLRLSVNKFDLAQGAELYTIQNVYGVAEQQASLINISQFNAQYTHYTSELSATLDLDQTNPISLNVSLRDDDNTLSIKANGDLNKLKIDAALHGENNAKLKAQIALIQPNLPFELALSSPLIKYIQQEQSISLSESQINLTGDLNQYNYRIISKITYEDFPEVKLTGTGQGDQFQTTLQELVAETEKSKLAVAGNISWQENINANLSIISDTFAIDEFVPEITSNLAINAKTVINANEQGWQVNLPSFEIAGKINNVPVELSTEFDLDDKFHFNIKKLDLHSGANQLAITGQLTDVWSVDGELSLTEPSSLDPHLSGQGNGIFSIKGDALKPSVNWLINLSNLAYKEIKLAQFSSQGQVDMAQNYLGNITINGSELNYQEQAIEQLEINVKGDLSKHLASLRVKSNIVNLQSKLTAGLDLTRYQVELEDLTLSHSEFNLANDRVINASFDRSSKATTVSSHCWKGRYSELCFADTRISPTEGELNLRLNELDLSGLGAFLPDTIITTGLITGDFNAKWQDSKVKTVSAELQSDAINVDIKESFVETHLPIDSVKISLNGDHDNLKFDTKIASSVLGELSSNSN
jgi:translocation and assembly module TamB